MQLKTTFLSVRSPKAILHFKIKESRSIKTDVLMPLWALVDQQCHHRPILPEFHGRSYAVCFGLLSISLICDIYYTSFWYVTSVCIAKCSICMFTIIKYDISYKRTIYIYIYTYIYMLYQADVSTFT